MDTIVKRCDKINKIIVHLKNSSCFMASIAISATSATTLYEFTLYGVTGT
jgi:hypothetical protein